MRRPIHTGLSDDPDALVRAMEPSVSKRFIAISAHGAGEAALVLASHGAKRVFAFDIEDSLTLARLLGLKLEAARLFSREDYLAIMGLRHASATRKKALEKQLLQTLSGDDLAYWRKRRAWLRHGLFHSDRVSQFFRAFELSLGVLAPESSRRQILSSSSREARLRAFRCHVDRPWLRSVLGAVGERVNLFFPDAEWHASHYPKAFNREPLRFLEHIVEAGLADNPLFAHHVLDRRTALPEELLPTHMRTMRYDGLRSAHERIRVVRTAKGASLPLEEASAPIHGAYLSNVIDFLGEAAREALFRRLLARMEPGAPILVYSNEAFNKVPAGRGMTLDAEATEDLARVDRANIYRRRAIYRADPGSAHAAFVSSRAAGRLRVVS